MKFVQGWAVQGHSLNKQIHARGTQEAHTALALPFAIQPLHVAWRFLHFSGISSTETLSGDPCRLGQTLPLPQLFFRPLFPYLIIPLQIREQGSLLLMRGTPARGHLVNGASSLNSSR